MVFVDYAHCLLAKQDYLTNNFILRSVYNSLTTPVKKNKCKIVWNILCVRKRENKEMLLEVHSYSYFISNIKLFY